METESTKDLDPEPVQDIQSKETVTTAADEESTAATVPTFVSTDPILVLEGNAQMGSGDDDNGDNPDDTSSNSAKMSTSLTGESSNDSMTTSPSGESSNDATTSSPSGESSNDSMTTSPSGESSNDATTTSPSGESSNDSMTTSPSGESSNDSTTTSPSGESNSESSPTTDMATDDDADETKKEEESTPSAEATLLTSITDLPEGLHQVYVKPSFWLNMSIEAIGRVLKVAAPTTHVYCAFDDEGHATRKQLLALHNDNLLAGFGLTYTESSDPPVLANSTLDTTQHGMWLTFKRN